MMARDMVPGKTYLGTADGPPQLDGVAFTVLATKSFDVLNASSVPHDDGGENSCILVAVLHSPPFEGPFDQSTAFSPGDWVIEVATDTNNPWLCAACFARIHGEEPDMAPEYTFKSGECFGCKRDYVIIFQYTA